MMIEAYDEYTYALWVMLLSIPMFTAFIIVPVIVLPIVAVINLIKKGKKDERGNNI